MGRNAMSVVRAMSSALLNRTELASAVGRSYNGLRDIYDTLGYARQITLQQMRERFERDDIASAIITRAPEATWRGGGDLIEDNKPDVTTDFEQAWMTMEDRLHIWSIFTRTDILAGLGHYAVIFIGAPGNTETEIPQLKSPDDVWYLAPFAEENIEEPELINDPSNPRFGKPEFYRIKGLSEVKSPPRKASNVGTAAKQVHWSRIIHIADSPLQNALFGQPRLYKVWNDLDNLDKVVGGGSEAFWIRAHQGMQVDIDKEIEMKEGEEQKLTEEIEEFQHQIRRAIRTRGTTVRMLGSDVANFDGPSIAILRLISSGSRIPLRILLGSERGELASTQDRDNWFDYISDRRKLYAGPLVVREFVDRLVKYGALPKPTKYDVRWSQIKSMDDTARADLGIKWSTVNRNMGDIVITPDEMRDRLLDWEPLDEAERAKFKKPTSSATGVGEGGQPVAQVPPGPKLQK
jgi:hypothetical protein